MSGEPPWCAAAVSKLEPWTEGPSNVNAVRKTVITMRHTTLQGRLFTSFSTMNGPQNLQGLNNSIMWSDAKAFIAILDPHRVEASRKYEDLVI